MHFGVTIKRSMIALLAALFVAFGAHAQGSITGKVVDIVDGRTFVLEASNGPITASIQYVDVPEPEQPLSGLVREHLKSLLFSRIVTFVPFGFSPRAMVGRVQLNGVDLGLQLVRDGAAWHMPPDRTGQGREESLIFHGHQELARTEKRGIWSIEGLTPPWIFRSRKGPLMIDAGFDKFEPRSATDTSIRNYRPARPDLDMWVEVGGEPFSQKNPTGKLFWGYDPITRIRNTSTPSIAQVVAENGSLLEVEIRTIYFQGEIRPRAPNTTFVLALLATSPRHNFRSNARGVIVADGVQIDLGSAQRFYRDDGRTVQEMLQYRIGGGDLRKIVAAKRVTIHAGGFSGECGVALKDAVQRLLDSIG
ncbi:MAG TPA: thermonuclease family protein [Pyrinomonadaceae bacterium]|nr:thermonuclease family protein [Pyrinomonadaceae bacterium]